MRASSCSAPPAPLFEAAGVEMREIDGGVVARRAAGGPARHRRPRPGPYPEFATDLQAPTDGRC